MELHDVEQHIGRQIKMLRIAEKMSQKALAAEMGITYQQVQKYENGLNKITVSRLWQICNIFQVTPDMFYTNILGAEDKNDLSDLIPNAVASSQDIKLLMAFKNIPRVESRALMIKICEEFALYGNYDSTDDLSDIAA